jgi:hypothetical protein
VHSYVLMTNHYHLLVETPARHLVAGMKWFQGTYTQRYNHAHRLVGHLFQGRYKAIPIEAEEPEYFRLVSDYIHLNPARAGCLDREDPDLASWKAPCRGGGERPTKRAGSEVMTSARPSGCWMKRSSDWGCAWKICGADGKRMR